MTPWRALYRAGVLGINRRNVGYIAPWNPRRHYPRVDDKLLTKRLCADAGIPVPRLIAAAKNPFDLKHILPLLLDQPDFVMKPARGAMGNGTLVVREVERGDGEPRFRLAGGRVLGPAEVLYHGSGIIAGLHSLGGQLDTAMVEERLVPHPELLSLSGDGVPDVRVIVYRGVPVMSMIRLPTRMAAGRANLHQGAVGAGIFIDSGQTCHAVWRNRPTRVHPDNRQAVVGREIPEFMRVLAIAVQAADQSELGYVGADVVIDARHGPMILELNARPGLSIQLANQAGLLPRLQAVDARLPELPCGPGEGAPPPLAARLALGQEIARAQRKDRP